MNQLFVRVFMKKTYYEVVLSAGLYEQSYYEVAFSAGVYGRACFDEAFMLLLHWSVIEMNVVATIAFAADAIVVVVGVVGVDAAASEVVVVLVIVVKWR